MTDPIGPRMADGSFYSGGGGGGLDLAGFGYATMIVGAVMQGVGAYYDGVMARERRRMQSINARFVQSLASINARAAETDAQLALEEGRREVGRLTLGIGAAKAARRASAAAAGVQLGTGGSAAEVEASLELTKRIDAMTIRRNAIRAAGAARTRRTNIITEGLLAGVSADNLNRSANAMRPASDAAAALVGSAGTVALQMSRDRRLASYMETI